MAGDVTCVLTVDRDGGVLLTQGEASYLGKVRHDARTGLIVERLDRFVNHHPGGATGCEKIDLELLGAVLFDILLGGQATRLPNYRAGERNDHPLDQTLGQLVAQWVRSTGDDGRFRLSLRFEDERSPLATYPWECLFVGQPDSADGYFLTKNATLMRLVPPTLEVAPADRLDILVAWAEPGGLPGLDGEGLCKSIRTAIGTKVKCHIDEASGVTWEKLGAEIEGRAQPLDILHLIAHGRRNGDSMELAFCPTEQASLLAAAHASRSGAQPPPLVAWTALGELKAALEGHQNNRRGLPRLVFLHACNSGRAAPGVDAFRGAAEMIARAGVPFVVAMQYEIANEDALEFTETFYRTIADPAASIDDAVSAGRSALGQRKPAWGHRRFATPVIYLRSETARLLKAGTGAEAPVAEARADLQPCPACQVRMVSRFAKYCPCEQKRKFKLCEAQHVNVVEAVECWRAGCDARFDLPVLAPAMTPAAPAPRASPRGELEA